jgi:xanthine dehydrogenase small subunit
MRRRRQNPPYLLSMQAKTIRFIRQGQTVTLGNVPPDRTLLEVLREDLGATGTKEGCGEGDCGACTVVLAQAEGDGVRWRAINSCIRLAHSIDGLALWTVEDLAAADGTPHPAQEALVQCHGSQCGFCTPGFVMSLFGMYQNHCARGQTISREAAQAELSGNLCRCTGYRPILDAAQQMSALPPVRVDEVKLLAQLKALDAPTSSAAVRAEPVQAPAYLLPTTLPELLALRAAHPNAQLVAGCTDAGLWVTKQHKRFDQVLDVTRVADLRRIEASPMQPGGTDGIAIGAAVTLADAFAALVAQRPQLQTFSERFAGLPVRNSGTLGGNVANGSPIGDSMPLLIALGAQVVLAGPGGERALPLEDFYTGYRQTALAPGEVLARILVPAAAEGEFMRVYKLSKRFDDDISAVCLAVNLRLQGGRVQAARIGAGGVAATPARARATEATLQGQAWTEALAYAAGDSLRAEFSPISDMRASAAYRRQVLGNLMRRFWLESQGLTGINLECVTLGEVSA